MDDGSRVPVGRGDPTGGERWAGSREERRAAGRGDRARCVPGQRHGASGRLDRGARRALRGSERGCGRAAGAGAKQAPLAARHGQASRGGRAWQARVVCARRGAADAQGGASRRSVRSGTAIRRGRGSDLAADRRRLARALRPQRDRRARGARDAEAALQVRDVRGAAEAADTPASSSTSSSGRGPPRRWRSSPPGNPSSPRSPTPRRPSSSPARCTTTRSRSAWLPCGPLAPPRRPSPNSANSRRRMGSECSTARYDRRTSNYLRSEHS